ncbi:MAG: polysaccharide biosynthesis protein [Saprospiraceae bacterium]|nr:polysaccharide biosynthesis protein [Saprospiraceae bacterium]MBK9630580.1 polysaccharide biosynthesis protein [Saprospiraceae bacterium]
MGIIRAQSVRSTMLIYLAMLIGLINLVLLMPQFFTKEQIGMTRTILTLSLLLSQFSEMGASGITYRFFPFYKKQNAGDLLFILLLITALGFTVVGGISYYFRDFIFQGFYTECPALKEFEHLIFLATFFTLYNGLGSYYCAVHLKTVVPRAINELVPRIGNTVLIILFAAGWIDFSTYFTLFTALLICMVVLIWAYIIYLKKLQLSFKISPVTRRIYKKMLIFGGMGLLGNSLGTLISYIDTLMLGSLSGQEDVAVFSIGYYLITIMAAPYQAIIAVVSPLLAKAIRHKEWSMVLEYYQKTSTNHFIIGSFIFGGILICFSDFIRLLPPAQGYEASFSIILFFGVGKLLDMISGCNAEIIAYSKYYKFNFYLQLFVALICIVTNYYFISEYGLNGAAISGLICLIIYNLARYFYVKLKMNMHPFSKSTIKSILVFALALTISWLIGYFIKINIDGHTYYSIGLNLFIKSGIWSILFMSLLYFIKPSEDIRLFFEVIKGKFVKTPSPNSNLS